MIEHGHVYTGETDRYHALVSYEDYQGNLPIAITEIIQPHVSNILETGAGTGRLTRLLLPLTDNIAVFDLSLAMLTTAKHYLPLKASRLTGLTAGDHRHLPVRDNLFDWIVSGWSICYLASWHKETWNKEVLQAFSEFVRVLKPEGKILIIETLGTGQPLPNPPAHLIEYVDFLDKSGFFRETIRTDYEFPNISIARDLVEFFFGEDMVEMITNKEKPILPEYSGLWTIARQDLVSNIDILKNH
jgi:ubiquinone/menaquinone biosynthesis C-methylase UbiE